jgi:hypothetical protein
MRLIIHFFSEETGKTVKLPSYDQACRKVHRLKSEPELVVVRERAKSLPRVRESPQSFALSIPAPSLFTQVDEHSLELYVVTPDGIAVSKRIHAAVQTAAILSAVLAPKAMRVSKLWATICSRPWDCCSEAVGVSASPNS